jgi:hypothetical protein
MDDIVSLKELPRALRDYTGGEIATYQMLYRYALNGYLPAQKSAGDRWLVLREDLPKIARTLGLGLGSTMVTSPRATPSAAPTETSRPRRPGRPRADRTTTTKEI